MHLEAAAERTGQRPPELDGAGAPLELVHVWDWYLALDAARGGSGFGPNPISYQEIAAWAQFSGARPTPFEVECLRSLDLAYLAHFAGEARKRRKT